MGQFKLTDILILTVFLWPSWQEWRHTCDPPFRHQNNGNNPKEMEFPQESHVPRKKNPGPRCLPGKIYSIRRLQKGPEPRPCDMWGLLAEGLLSYANLCPQLKSKPSVNTPKMELQEPLGLFLVGPHWINLFVCFSVLFVPSMGLWRTGGQMVSGAHGAQIPILLLAIVCSLLIPLLGVSLGNASNLSGFRELP